MRIAVTGLEGSGTKWVTELISFHPRVREAVHTSIPEFGWPNSRWPNLDGYNAVVWVIRYEPIRIQSANSIGYSNGRPEEFLLPNVYKKAVELTDSTNAHIVSYDSLIGPFGELVFKLLLRELGLSEDEYQMEHFNPVDKNLKYLK